MSHPLLVEAIERCFVPVAIRNNTKGDREAAIRERFEEPAWNNPVLRFVDHRGRDILPRKDRVWSREEVTRRLIAALEAAKAEVPPWLRLLADEFSPKKSVITLGMHCFWEGEAALGAIGGVTKTTAGWSSSNEVVRVEYVETVVDDARLMRAVGASESVTDDKFRSAKLSDRKHALMRSPYRFVPMTEGQRTRVNAALHAGQNASAWLSPRGVKLLRVIESVLERMRDGVPADLPILPSISAFDTVEARWQEEADRSDR
ncbi:MAG: hypothetical protein H6832_12855 [Planctomycetes bacterium]|nr:hypothetical protein [Planctomycetota bacterium]